MEAKEKKFSKWRLLGLIPIAIWLYNLIINLFIIPERFGPQNAAYAWHYNLWSCPLLGLIIGIGILTNSKFLTGAGALWGLFPVFLADILMITPAARELAAAQGFSIPFLKMTPEFKMMYERFVGETGVTLIIIEEFATHWIGDFLFGLIGLAIIGISKWSFVGTAVSFLFTAWFTQTICPFYPPNPPGAPSLFVQAIPMIVIWFVLNISINGLLNNKDKKKKILYGFLTAYWILSLLIFNSLAEDTYKPLLAVGYLVLYLIGHLIVGHRSIIPALKQLYERRVRWLLYLALVYLILFSAFFFAVMRPTMLQEGEGVPIMAYSIFGLLPFLFLMLVSLVIVPGLRKKKEA